MKTGCKRCLRTFYSPFSLRKTGYYSPFYLAEKRVNQTDVRFLGHLLGRLVQTSRRPVQVPVDTWRRGKEKKRVPHVKCWMT